MQADGTSAVERFISRYLNLRLLFEQADVALPVPQFLMICGVPGRGRARAADRWPA